jgi:hypothetical protein
VARNGGERRRPWRRLSYWEEGREERSARERGIREKRGRRRGVQGLLQGVLLGVGAASRTWSTASSGPAKQELAAYWKKKEVFAENPLGFERF